MKSRQIIVVVSVVSLAGLVLSAACSNSSPPPPPAASNPTPENCDCRMCGCADTGNMCTHNTCDFIAPGVYKCQTHVWTDSRVCNDSAAHHGDGITCIVSGHCNQTGQCSSTVGSNNEWYTCDPNSSCICGCGYDDGTAAYSCCSGASQNCPQAPTCAPSTPACGGAVDTTDGYCTMHHHKTPSC